MLAHIPLYISESKAANVFSHLLLIATWLLLWRLAMLMEYAPHASIWFPPAGLTFSAFLLLGRKVAGSIAIACVLSTFWENSIFQYGRSLPELLGSGIIFAILHTTIYAIGAKYLRSAIVKINTKTLYHVIVRFLIAVAVSSLLMAISGMLLLTDVWSLGLFRESVLTWWIGDMTGALVLAPMFVGIINRIHPKIGLLSELRYAPKGRQSTLYYCAKLFVSASYLVVVTLLANHYQSAEIACFIFFLALPQMWIVHTETAFRAAIGLAVLSFTSAALIMQFGMDTYAYIYQFSLNVTACSTYFSLGVPALVSYNKSLFEKAHTDFLTKTLSREQFYYLSERRISHNKRNNEGASLLLFDIDNFKKINDTHGHTIGDEVLSQLAKRVQESLRSTDLLGRFGGDEFIVLLPNTSVEKAYQVAEQLRLRINAEPFSAKALSITCSFGITQVVVEQDLHHAFQAADSALLQAKKQGKNTTHHQ